MFMFLKQCNKAAFIKNTVKLILCNIIIYIYIFFFFEDPLVKHFFKRTAFVFNIFFCIIMNIFTDIFDQFNASLLKKKKYFLKKKKSYPKL